MTKEDTLVIEVEEDEDPLALVDKSKDCVNRQKRIAERKKEWIPRYTVLHEDRADFYERRENFLEQQEPRGPVFSLLHL